MTKFYNRFEIKIFSRLNTPAKIQDYINRLPINFEKRGETAKSPRRVLQTKSAHCMEGAMLAAAILEFHGHKPLLIDLVAKRPDDDHVLALFKVKGYFGAITKTNHAVLRYREPIYKTIRELAFSYFHEYFSNDGKKMLRSFSDPIDLRKYHRLNWRTSEKDLFAIPRSFNKLPHHQFLKSWQARGLRKADKIEIKAGKLIEFSG